jgi:hypothetical protein
MQYSHGPHSFAVVVIHARRDEYNAIPVRRDDDGRMVKVYPEQLEAIAEEEGMTS